MSHQVRLDDDVYERIKHQKRSDETFSEAIDRLTSEWTLLDFPARESVVNAETHRDALVASAQQGIEDTTDGLQGLGVDVES